jgi:catechol 2,3-dioxygenase-like lactoylglutathione lyase family enzyme
MNSKLRHVGIVVQDLDTWLEFFISTLNFEVWVEKLESGEFVSNLIGIPKTTVRTIKLKDKSGGVIELLHFVSPVGKSRKRKEVEPNTLGITHIALQVISLDEKLEILAKAGYSPINQATISEDGLAKVCYLRGPENVLFELVQLL